MAIFGRRRDVEDLGAVHPRELWSRVKAIPREIDADDDPAARAAEVERLTVELLRRYPDHNGSWYERGLLAKWRKDWPAALEHNRRALDLLAPDQREGEPDAWNLGIAATALRDWATARDAWTAFGIRLPESADAGTPIEADFGVAPVRLNADPRFVGQTLPVIDGDTWRTEVVWGRRLCPARIRIESVPSRDSGHRCGDIVLHDGDPVGTRMLGDHEVSVFNEILLWERSPVPTWTVEVMAPDQASIEDLLARFDDADCTAEDWTSNLQILCKACSEGSPGHDHDHATPITGPRTVALSARRDQATALLEAWTAAAPGRTSTPPDLILA